jgi:hypothetical protein
MSDPSPLKLHVVFEPHDQPAPSKPWFDHPAARAIGIFILTTVVGGLLSARWQSQHWEEQQAYAARNERAKARLDLSSAVTRRVSEAFSASNQIVYLTVLSADGTFAQTRNSQLSASLQDWLAQNRQWRIEEKVLLAETRANFSDHEIHTLLRQIVANRETLSRLVTQFIEISQGGPVPAVGNKRRDELEAVNPKIFNIVAETTGPTGLLPRLSELMIREARAGQEPPPRPWYRRLL